VNSSGTGSASGRSDNAVVSVSSSTNTAAITSYVVDFRRSRHLRRCDDVMADADRKETDAHAPLVGTCGPAVADAMSELSQRTVAAHPPRARCSGAVAGYPPIQRVEPNRRLRNYLTGC